MTTPLEKRIEKSKLEQSYNAIFEDQDKRSCQDKISIRRDTSRGGCRKFQSGTVL